LARTGSWEKMISKNLKITGLNIEGWGRGKGEKTTLFVRREDNRNQGGGKRRGKSG